MKTKPTKIDRSGAKWLPGAMALAATTASTQAAVVQITLTGNKISTAANNLYGDLTGDSAPDVGFNMNPLGNGGVAGNMSSIVGGVVGGVRALYQFGVFYGDPQFVTGGIGSGLGNAVVPRSAKYLNPVRFSDPNINGGLVSFAWLEVHAFNESKTSHTVQLTRLIFDDGNTSRPVFTEIPGVLPQWGVSAVPEPSGFLATSLLLGAAGLIRRRQARAA